MKIYIAITAFVLFAFANWSLAEIPALLEADDPRKGHPYDWVSLSEIQSSKEPEDLLSRESFEKFQDLRLYIADNYPVAKSGSEECDIVDLRPRSSPPTPPMPRSISDYSHHSSTVLAGSIIDVDIGFFRGDLGTLFELDVTEDLKSNAAHKTPRKILLFKRSGTIDLGTATVCIRQGRKEIPVLTSRVLVALESRLPLIDNPIVPIKDHEWFFTTPEGQTSLPREFDSQEMTLDQITTNLALHISTEGSTE